MSMAHVATWKIERVKQLVDMIVSSPVIGIANIEGIPARQIQKMRRNLINKTSMVVSKNTLFNLAFKEAAKQKEGIDRLIEVIDGPTALIATQLNPFKLFKELESTKTEAPAKGGEIATEDIEVKAGQTSFKPGPIVGELQKAGIPAKIEGGAVVISKDKVMVKQGEKIPAVVAKVLTRLEIYPLTVGLDLRGVFEDGTFFPKAVLQIDDAIYINNVRLASVQAMNLAIYAGYTTKITIKPLLLKAHSDALNLAINAEIFTKESIDVLLQKANVQMLSLALKTQDALDDDLRTLLSLPTKELKKSEEVEKEKKEKPAEIKKEKEAEKKKEEKPAEIKKEKKKEKEKTDEDKNEDKNQQKGG
jgi:large subunit ribosomal protein L10